MILLICNAFFIFNSKPLKTDKKKLFKVKMRSEKI